MGHRDRLADLPDPRLTRPRDNRRTATDDHVAPELKQIRNRGATRTLLVARCATPRVAGPVKSPTRCRCDNEGRCALAVAARPECDFLMPRGVAAARWPLRRKFGSAGASASAAPPLSRLQLARSRLAPRAPGWLDPGGRPDPGPSAEMRARSEERRPIRGGSVLLP